MEKSILKSLKLGLSKQVKNELTKIKSALSGKGKKKVGRPKGKGKAADVSAAVKETLRKMAKGGAIALPGATSIPIIVPPKAGGSLFGDIVSSVPWFGGLLKSGVEAIGLGKKKRVGRPKKGKGTAMAAAVRGNLKKMISRHLGGTLKSGKLIGMPNPFSVPAISTSILTPSHPSLDVPVPPVSASNISGSGIFSTITDVFKDSMKGAIQKKLGGKIFIPGSKVFGSKKDRVGGAIYVPGSVGGALVMPGQIRGYGRKKKSKKVILL